MTIATQQSLEVCFNCGHSFSFASKHCPACETDAGAPNVRESLLPENVKTLESRFSSAETHAKSNGYFEEFKKLKEMIKVKSNVVIAMPVTVLHRLFIDMNSLYSNYDKLVGAGARTPATPENDRQRCAVSGQLFGSYAKEISYGVLSLTNQGLPTYGDVYCKIQPITIEKRTSFLEMNSYDFVEKYGSNLPAGYRASWEYRDLLVMSKLSCHLLSGQSESDWQEILIKSDGKDRKKDDFVEAHIFGSFNKNAIEGVEKNTDTKLDRMGNSMLRIVLSGLKKRGK